jgi:hypothetical protein
MANTPNPDPPIEPAAPVAQMSGEAEKPRPVDPALEPEAPGLLSDCRLMLSYSRKNAFVIPPALLHEIAWLDSFLKSKGISPISSITSRLVSTIDTAKGEPRYMAAATLPIAQPSAEPAGLSAEEVILDVHGQLSTLISPTTALSLQTSEPPPGKTHVLGGMPPLVRTVIGVAVCSALVFVATALAIARNAAKAAADEKEAKALEVAAAASATAALNRGKAGSEARAAPASSSSGAKP